MAISGTKYLLIIVIHLVLRFMETEQSLLGNINDDTENFNLIKEYLKSQNDTPSLIGEIAELEQNDGLEKYKRGLENEDVDLNITQLIKKYGYECEVHTVTTWDGYILTMYRIPGDGPSALLMHGLPSSSDDFVTVGPEQALPYLLSKKGYDVWLGNARGNYHSRKHIYLSPDKDEARFFDYTWHQIGYYDLPAMIDHILGITGKESLNYVGHSQGTTVFFVMCSERPEYNKKIKLMVSLSTIVYMSHLVSPLIRLASPAAPAIYTVVTRVLGFKEVPKQNPLFDFLYKTICGNAELATLICANIMFAVFGFDYDQLNMTNLPVIFGHTPSGASMNQYYHYAQEINSGKFRQYDHGPIKNLQKYGTVEPPEYKLENVNAPVAILYSKFNDWLSAYEDVVKLTKRIQNVVEFYQVKLEKFNHVDYLWAKDVYELVYKKVLELFDEFNY